MKAGGSGREKGSSENSERKGQTYPTERKVGEREGRSQKRE